MTDSGDPNKVYEISMSTVIKMECDDCEKAKYIEKGKEGDILILWARRGKWTFQSCT